MYEKNSKTTLGYNFLSLQNYPNHRHSYHSAITFGQFPTLIRWVVARNLSSAHCPCKDKYSGREKMSPNTMRYKAQLSQYRWYISCWEIRLKYRKRGRRFGIQTGVNIYYMYCGRISNLHINAIRVIMHCHGNEENHQRKSTAFYGSNAERT